nr:immunoglobulin light chain junction region [Macaca mulatta]MOV97462.1 immunoglobulin light chain junction region [Macaca mulatta]MOV98427.1 immunoglobulin light chain junction region [Macaca mulatta]MOV99237.1 immunoglobulin light chain junction region [Macaca mulatta]MOW00174.1 immunoglobulin light chain junction region [Macaca mulatta]
DYYCSAWDTSLSTWIF